MPRVPEYTPNVSAIPDMQGRLAPVATGEAFGASIGRGLANLGAGVSKIGAALEAVRDLEDEARVREARNQYMRERDALMYDPQNGYMFTQGRNALDQRSSFVDSLRKLREKYAKDLNPRQQQLFAQSVEPLEIDSERSAAVHAGGELKNYIIEGSKASAENFGTEALRHINNPEMANKYLAAGLLELRELGRKQGLSPDQQEAMERDYLSQHRYNSALMIAADDPIKAEKYVEEYKNELTPQHQHDLKQKLQPLVDDAKSMQYYTEWERRTSQAKQSGNVVKLINQGAVRKQPITETLTQRLTDAVVSVYGPGYRAEVYSGGQPAPGQGRRVGSTRHDHGRAADVYIIGPDGKRVTGDDLAPLAQYWLAKGYGGVGLEMRGGGIHLDEHTDRARTWNYLKAGGRYTEAQRRAVQAGLRGELPSVVQSADGKAIQATGGDDTGVGAVSSRPTGDDLVSFLNSIEDPKVRAATYQRIKAANEIRAQQEKANLELLKSQAFAAVEQGISPDQLPVDVRVQLGRTEMDGLWDYYTKSQTGRIVTNEEVLSELRRMYAEDPVAFSQVDLWQYKAELSKEDWRMVDGWRQTALTDQRKAREEGAVYTDAMNIARSQLEAVGLTTTGKTGDEREAVAKRIQQFEMILQQELMAWMKANDGRVPPYEEIQKIVNRLLLPAVIKQERSIWNPLKTPWTQFSERQGFLFEAPFRPDDTEAEVRVNYEDIPADLRRVIEADLESELGRKPSREEIAARYAEFLLNR